MFFSSNVVCNTSLVIIESEEFSTVTVLLDVSIYFRFYI